MFLPSPRNRRRPRDIGDDRGIGCLCLVVAFAPQFLSLVKRSAELRGKRSVLAEMQPELADDRSVLARGGLADAQQRRARRVKHGVVEPIGGAVEVAGGKVPLGRGE